MDIDSTLRNEPLSFNLSYLRLFSITSPMLVCSYSLNDLLDHPDWEPGWEGELPDNCQGILARSQPLPGGLDPIGFDSDHVRYVAKRYERHFIDLRATFDDYIMSNFSSKTRSTLRRKERRFAEAGGGETRTRSYRTPEELREFFPSARAISEKTYQERLLEAGLPSSAGFQQRMLAAGAEDSVRAYILFLEEQPVAYLYCPLRQGVVIYQYLGYDPAFSNLSPGTVLQMAALKSLFGDERCDFFDFTEGESAQKRLFGTNSLLCGDVYYFRRNVRNIVVVHGHRSAILMTSALARAMERLGLKHRTKALLRRLGR